MSRIHWLSAGVVSAVFAAAFAQDAGAQVTCTVTVTGQNNPAVDAAAVQSATNQAFVGDLTVCLEGTFDFAPPVAPSQFSVAIVASPFTTSLRIVGLDNANGRKATVRNGRQALTKLGAADPELARLVEWRYFAGLSIEEIAELLAVSDRTVKRHWRLARAYLFQELQARGAAS